MSKTKAELLKDIECLEHERDNLGTFEQAIQWVPR